MKRNIIKLGDKTFVITLPTEWLKKFNLGKGNGVDVDEINNKLLVSTDKSYTETRIQIDLEGLDERVIRWYLSALHKYGYDEIEIIYNTKKNLVLIEELLKNLYTGFTVIKETEKLVVIKCIAEEIEQEFDAALRRAFRVTISMGDELIEATKEKKTEEIELIKQKELINNQLTNFCERILNKRGYKDFRKNTFLYVIIWNLEKVCDNYKYICDLLVKEKKWPSAEILKLFAMANEYLGLYYEMFYDFEAKRLNILSRKKEEIFNFHKNAKIKEEIDKELANYLITLVIQCTDFSASMIAFRQKD